MEFVLSMIARPLAFLLQLLYSLIGNYGISLIVLTTVIKLAMYPSYKAQMMSTMGMQDLQPKVREIQNRYANDRQMMNQKMQELYQQEGVSPTAGCLPMIVQMVVIMGLFTLLRDPVRFMSSEKMVFAIHESFLWIEDLAQPDPWILPILAGLATFASFFFQHNPSQGGANDIMQKMMKYVFPIMIMWLAKSYPAGLALYWFVSQFLQIFFNLRFDMLKKKQMEEKNGSRKRKPVRAGKGVN
ncbi:MAG: membrane protein insertase YidC [Eubacterium sp.]|nr:membrane protein insertase YidC [Eubacterium sp.]